MGNKFDKKSNFYRFTGLFCVECFKHNPGPVQGVSLKMQQVNRHTGCCLFHFAMQSIVWRFFIGGDDGV
jgi:hypothetical protein